MIDNVIILQQTIPGDWYVEYGGEHLILDWQKVEAEIERLRAVVEDAIETLEAMDLHVDNPLYVRLCRALGEYTRHEH